MRNSLSLLTGQPNKIFASRGTLASRYKAGGVIPRYILDARTPRYFSEAIRQDELTDIVTHTRASTATYVGSNGVLQTAGVNVPRIGHHVWNGSAWVNEGLLHESEARTNLVRNSTLAGAAVGSLSAGGSLPTNWTKNAALADADVEVVAVGTTSGFDYIDIRFNGTLASNNVQLGFESQTSTSVTNGVVTTGSVFAQRIAGTLTNITVTSLIHIYYVSGGTYHSAQAKTISISDSRLERYHATDTASDADGSGTIATARHILQLAATSGNAIDITIRFAAPQFEVGPTPSSYIPTSGSTVTRAADVLTIPAANLPWPAPEVIGPELVTNGTFDTDVTGWTDSSSVGGSISWNASGYLDLNATTATSRAVQDVAVTAGSVYAVSVTVVDLGGSGASALYLDGASSSNINFVTSGVGTHTIYYVAPDSSMNISVRNFSTGTTVSVDNISVREINPLAVSIQMEGRVTYADTDSALEAWLVRWEVDGSNKIVQYLNTASTATGRMSFQQAQAGVFDTVSVASSNPLELSPGILVPFNIASRHGSTFVNGAVDGVALTANTTPVALPDLSANNLSLGNKYNGTIRTFRMWPNDLGDTGIEEASA